MSERKYSVAEIDRMRRAQERAATVGVRLTLPLVLCLLPALMTVLMGGAAYRFLLILLPNLGGPGHG